MTDKKWICQERSFGEFLRECQSEPHGHTETDFVNWLECLRQEDFIKYADLYGKEQYIAGAETVLHSFKSFICK